MTTVTFQEEKKKGYLALIALVVIVLLIFIVFRHGASKEGRNSMAVPAQPSSFSLEEIKINLDIFKNPFFEKALPFEKIKPFEGQIGRENPFAPYPAVLPTSTVTSTSASSSTATSGTPVVPIGPSM